MSSRRSTFMIASVAGLALTAGLSLAQATAPVIKPAQPPQQVPAPVQATAPATPVPTGPSAKIEFSELTHEFGVISDEKEVETAFKFTNKGDSDLEIKNIQGSCGCTVPQLEKKIYAPGESGEIKVKYNPHNRRGPQHTNVTVTTNDPAKAQVVLGVKSEVKPTIMTDPQVAALGQIERGKPGKTMIKITSRKLDFVPTQITPADAKIEAKIGERAEVTLDGEKVVEYPVEISLSPTAAVGPIQTQCTIRTNDPAKTLNFMVLGEVVGQIKSEPQRITLGGLQPDQDINTTFRLTPRGETNFSVLSVTEEPAPQPQPNNPQGGPGAKVFKIEFKHDTSVTPAAWVVTLTGKAPAEGANTFRGDLVIKTDMPGEETVKVPYYGFIRQKPRPVPGQSPAGQPSGGSMLLPGN